MNIGIDLRHIQLGKSGGIAQLLQGVLTELFEQSNYNEYTIFCTIFNSGLINTNEKRVNIITLPISNYYSELDRFIEEFKIEILFRSFPAEDDLKFPLSKQLILIPDLQHEIFPEFFISDILRLRRLAFNRFLAKAGSIITISEYTKETLIKHPWTRCKNISIVSPALQSEFENFSEEGATNHLIPEKDYFLFSANLWPHKNHNRVLQAFRLFLEKTDAQVQFVLTGDPSCWNEVKKDFLNLPITHLGFVSASHLAALMKNANLFVFFSLFEGFGIPLLEAFHSGTPVICSNTSSLPEIGGDAVLTCDPTDVSAMCGLMEEIYFNKKLREQLIANGKKRLQFYSWSKAARNLLEACDCLIEKNRHSNNQNCEEKNDKPLVTIVTPSYNQGKFIGRTIESVLNQTYPNIEYIIIDGNSTDNTKEILNSYNNKFYWISELVMGQANAINKGFKLANGEILAYLNSDDVLMIDAVEKIVDYFLNHPDCDLVYGKGNIIDENDKIIRQYKTNGGSFERLLHDRSICQPATFWRKRISDLAGLFNEEIHYAMDYEYWFRVNRIGGSIHFFPEFLASSREHDSKNTLRDRNKMYNNLFKGGYTGYISYNYFVGLWKYRFNEDRSNILWNILSRLISSRIMATIHYILTNKTIKKVIKYFSAKKGKGIGFVDNWLKPKAKFFVSTQVSKQFNLVGTAPVDTELLIKQGKKIKFRKELKRGEIYKISIDMTSHSWLVFKFSNYIIDNTGRKLAFLVKSIYPVDEHDIRWKK